MSFIPEEGRSGGDEVPSREVKYQEESTGGGRELNDDPDEVMQWVEPMSSTLSHWFTTSSESLLLSTVLQGSLRLSLSGVPAKNLEPCLSACLNLRDGLQRMLRAPLDIYIEFEESGTIIHSEGEL